MTKFPITVNGVKKLRDELRRLKTEERPRIITAIADARGHGDLRENAEYHAAREQQSFCEGRIKEIEGKLSEARVIDVKSIPNSGKVIFGVTVRIVNCDTEEAKTYRIVGEDEADVKKGMISITSPIARALIGKEVDDVVTVVTPSGEVDYEIESVEHI